MNVSVRTRRARPRFQADHVACVFGVGAILVATSVFAQPLPGPPAENLLEHPRQRGSEYLLEHPRQRGSEYLLEPALPFEISSLDNGLELLLHEDHRIPQVAVNVWVRAGFANDPPGKRGLAHLFEHLMLRGSKHVGRDKFFSTLESAGASDRNATTSFDRTSYYETLPSNQLALALWLESDRQAFLLDTLDAGMLETEKNVVRNEHRSSTLDAPYALVSRYARNAIYPAGHPYHWDVEGELEELDAITVADLRAFFRTYYVASNFTLAIAGDIEPVKARALVATYFGSFPRAPVPPAKVATQASLSGDVRIAMDAGVEQARLQLGWPAPARFTRDDTALRLVDDVLARSKGGRLYRTLVEGSGVAASVGSGPDVMGERLATIHWLRVDIKRGQDPERALREVDRVLDDLNANGPTDEELGEARARFTADLYWSLESATRRADLLNAVHWFGGVSPPASALSRTQDDVKAMTRESVRDAVRRWLPKQRRVVVIVTPEAGAPVSGKLHVPSSGASP